MTMVHQSTTSIVPQPVQSLIEATRELRDAKAELRAGNVIRGVRRHETAKSALYRMLLAMQSSLQGNQPDQERLSAFLQASAEFQNAYDGYRNSGADSRFARIMVDAERNLLGALEALERASN